MAWISWYHLISWDALQFQFQKGQLFLVMEWGMGYPIFRQFRTQKHSKKTRYMFTTLVGLIAWIFLGCYNTSRIIERKQDLRVIFVCRLWWGIVYTRTKVQLVVSTHLSLKLFLYIRNNHPKTCFNINTHTSSYCNIDTHTYSIHMTLQSRIDVVIFISIQCLAVSFWSFWPIHT